MGLLNADPTLQYGLATAENGDAAVDDWGGIEWWPRLQVGGADVQLPNRLAGYQTYLNKGLPPIANRVASRQVPAGSRARRHGQRLLLLRGGLPGRRARRLPLLRAHLR